MQICVKHQSDVDLVVIVIVAECGNYELLRVIAIVVLAGRTNTILLSLVIVAAVIKTPSSSNPFDSLSSIDQFLGIIIY